jgi:23S rRNA (guanosine2251-2'-O)-methyltransferase
MKEWIYGRNAVHEVLRARRRQVFGLRIAQGVQVKGRLAEIVKICTERRIPAQTVPRQQLDTLGEGHQGVALQVSQYPYSALADILNLAQQRGEPPFVLILDTLQDPQNLGTLLRTAEAVGVHGVLLPLRHAATVTPAVVNVSSGASEHLLIAQSNLAQAIAVLKDAGAWVIGLEGETAEQPEGLPVYTPEQARLDGGLALVVGNEGQGIRTLVRQSCDALLQLPMRGKLESLNAAVAGSIALYLAWQARGFGRVDKVWS